MKLNVEKNDSEFVIKWKLATTKHMLQLFHGSPGRRLRNQLQGCECHRYYWHKLNSNSNTVPNLGGKKGNIRFLLLVSLGEVPSPNVHSPLPAELIWSSNLSRYIFWPFSKWKFEICIGIMWEKLDMRSGQFLASSRNQITVAELTKASQ